MERPDPDDTRAFLAGLEIEYDPEPTPRVRIRRDRLKPVDRAYISVPDLPEDERVRDIYGAQNAYLGQPDGERADLVCLCSDDACRAEHRPRIVAAAYRRPEREEERYDQRAHFRWRPNFWHSLDCVWVIAEVAARYRAYVPVERGEAEQLREERARRRQQTPRRTDVVDVFVIRQQHDPELRRGQVDLGPAIGEHIAGRNIRNVARRVGDAFAALGDDHPTRSSFLREVISSYELLKREQRETEVNLSIQGVERSYYTWFRRVNLYYAVDGDKTRIWSGGVRNLEDFPDSYRLTFFDPITVNGVTERPFLVLNKGQLAAHPRGLYLLEALRRLHGRDVGYLRAWFYGDFIGMPQHHTVLADYGENLERVHLAMPATNA